ncbi:MAG: hypothetical protein ACK4E3_08515 [Brevundimonas sp.]|uniref:hypothetical protein n=1 Tax=Brevundimonas sp. TaxID=1871086 RepID=UPI00391DBBE9
MASAFSPHQSIARSRYLIVPCEAAGCEDLAVIWDRLEEQVVDVIDASSRRYDEEDALWDEFHAPRPGPDHWSPGRLAQAA